MNLDRRKFIFTLGAATIASQTVLRGANTTPAATTTPLSSASPWHQQIRRVGQLNFNERDPLELDVTAWADTWAELKVDAVLISVTGIIAFYPTAIPFHRRSQFLGDRDLFGECCAAAKKRGIRVIARFSPDLLWQEALDAHPEWFRHDAKGQPVPHAPVPGLFNTCPFSAYYSEQIPAIMREINARYDVDGLFTNAWPSLADLPECHCVQCREAPAPNTPAFHERHLQRTVELWRLYTKIAREKKPDNIFYGNLGWGIGAQTNLKILAEDCLWFNCDNQGREGEASPAWTCAQQGRVAHSVMQGRTTTSVVGSWATGGIKWRNTAKSYAETTLWMAQTVASGMRVWYHWLGGQTGLGEDRRWRKAGRDFFQWQARHDPHFTYRRPIANLGVVWAQRPNAFYSPPGATPAQRHSATEFMQGLYSVLLEGRFLFDFVHEDDLSTERLRKYDVLILPNVALLSDAQCDQLRAFTERGGSLLASFETGLFTETGAPRSDFALQKLFGVSRSGEVQGPVANYGSYARIENAHEILSGFDDTHWLPGAQYVVPVAASGGLPPLTVVRSNSGYPPEMAYTPESHTHQPAVVLRENGRSRLAYFPGDNERSAWRSGNTDLAQLLQNTIHWLAQGRSPVSVTGEGMVELFAWETDPGFAVHILNYNNPNLHRGWLRRHYPIGSQVVTMEIPAGRKITRVELLRAEREIPFTQNGSRIEFTVPRVNDYESRSGNLIIFLPLIEITGMKLPGSTAFISTLLGVWFSVAAAFISFGSEHAKSIPVPGEPHTISLVDGVSLDLQWIPAGTFLRGSPETEVGRKPDESPQARVTLTQGFWLGKTMITVAQWKQVMHLDLRGQLARRINDDTPYDLGGKSLPLRDFMRWSRDADLTTYLANEDDDLPMYFVSWNDAMEFCQRLTQIERAARRLPAGYEYNLPTEAQWEYACRAGDTSALDAAQPTQESLNRIAWYDKNSADAYQGRRIGPTHSGPRAVAQKEPNAWGLYDMYGNVWQWCRDWYVPYPKEDIANPTGPGSGILRVNRGGSFGSGPNALRPAARAANPPAEASAYRGFRVALCPTQTH